jgi:hypothetical protein
MMGRANWFYGIRYIAVALSLVLAAGVMKIVIDRINENRISTIAHERVQELFSADTSHVPDIIKSMNDYRRWVELELNKTAGEEWVPEDSLRKLRASLALLQVDPEHVDPAEVDYLITQMLSSGPEEARVIQLELRDYFLSNPTNSWSPRVPVAMRSDTRTRWEAPVESLWKVLEEIKSVQDKRLLPAASALASYDPENARWADVSSKVANSLASVNSTELRPWLHGLQPVKSRLTPTLAKIFRNKELLDSMREQACDILADYAKDDPNLIADLLMGSDTKAYAAFFPIAERQQEKTLALFQAELLKKPTYSWNDPPLDPSWTKPDGTSSAKIESAGGLRADRFAVCQTMLLDDFLTTAEALRKSGYRPIRFRPYADEQVIRVAAVWSRDGRNWRLASGLNLDEVRRQDEHNQKAKFLPVDVAGYVMTGAGGRPTEKYAAIWEEKTGNDDARMYFGVTTDDQSESHHRLLDERLIPWTLHATIGSDGLPRYFNDANFEAFPLYGLDPTIHLQKSRELIAQGYRPVSWSVSRCDPSGPLVTASVWHRPTVQEDVKDRLAERQARAAIGLVRMGRADEVWTLLRHSPDPRLRSFIINWLRPLGADPKLITTKLDQIAPSATPTPAPGQQRMDAILFHPETSMRRALILALGTYGMEGLSPGEREPLTTKLLDLYGTDRDAGIHGAVEWTLRKWRQQDKLKEADARLMNQKDRGERRWFINTQGQTFAVIDGPVEFRIGSLGCPPEIGPANKGDFG